MIKYFTSNGEITEAEAAKIEKENQKIMRIQDRREWLKEMLKAQFVLKYDTDHPEKWRRKP